MTSPLKDKTSLSDLSYSTPDKPHPIYSSVQTYTYSVNILVKGNQKANLVINTVHMNQSGHSVNSFSYSYMTCKNFLCGQFTRVPPTECVLFTPLPQL